MGYSTIEGRIKQSIGDSMKRNIMKYTDDNMDIVARKIADNMSLEDLKFYVAEDYFFQFDQDSELFEDQVKELELDT